MLAPVAPPPPPAELVEYVADHAQNYLSEHGLHMKMPLAFSGFSNAPLGVATANAAVYLHTGEWQATPEMGESLHETWRVAKDPRVYSSSLDLSSFTTILHESLHLVNPKASEGLVEAVAADHTKRFARRMGVPIKWTTVSVAYPAQTNQVRQATACGLKWWSPCSKQVRVNQLREAR